MQKIYVSHFITIKYLCYRGEKNRLNHQELLKQSCEQMGIPLSQEQIQQFMAYKDCLLEWNEKMNLTAITEEKEIIQKHFVDCISIATASMPKENASVIDVGTGAGFPGVPLKIVFPSLKVTLLDSLQKRISFLEEVVNRLQLQGVNCIHSRAEDGGQNVLYREQFDYCMSRAVASLPVLLEYCLPFVKEGGYFISMKGPGVQEELKDSQKALEILGGRVERIQEVAIPYTDLKHTIVVIKKIGQTPKQYPRKAGKIIKNPIV